MKRFGGQVMRVAVLALRGLVALFLILFALLALGLGALAYRLNQGPLDIPYVASRLATAVSGQGIAVHIGQAALAWAAYKQGSGAPLYLQLRDIRISNPKGQTLATAPRARLLFPARAIFGVPAPVDVAGEGAHLAMSDSAVGVAALLRFGYGFGLRDAAVTVTLGAGTLGPAGESLPVTGGGFRLHLAGPDAAVQNGRLTLRPTGGSAPVLTFAGTAHRSANWLAQLTLTVDAVQAADLPAYWPPQLGKGARAWVTANIRDGVASNGSFHFTLNAPADLSTVALQAVDGGFDGAGLSLRWLPGAHPITALAGQLRVVDPDTIVITETSAVLGRLALSAGAMRITGITGDVQTGAVSLLLTGQLADLAAELNAPPLNLLAQAPAALSKAMGMVRATVKVTLPLLDKVKLTQIDLAADAKLTDVTVPTPLAGLAVSAGNLRLLASATQLSVSGTAAFAGEASLMSALVIYNATPVLRRFEMKTMLGPAVLGALGLRGPDAFLDGVPGAVPARLRIIAQEDGAEAATLDADLTPATLNSKLLGWAKHAGEPGTLQVEARLNAAGAPTVQSVAAHGPALDVRGTLRGQVLHLAPLDIGRTAAAGDITFPGASKTPWLVSLRGASLDIRPLAGQGGAGTAAPAKPSSPATAPPKPAVVKPQWQADLQFGTVYLAKPPAPALRNMTLTGNGAGGDVQALRMAAVSQAGQPVSLLISAPAAAARTAVHLQAGDGGDLLRVLDLFDDVRGGALDLAAGYGAGAPFAGTVTLSKFQLLQAPKIGKILQALTIYGAGEAATGPGLVFSRLIAPFSVAGQVLTLNDARAYSASLGFTTAGTVDLGANAADLTATVIPAYALNTLPGKIPLLGKLFTAEKGGGLFAVRVTITGPLANPRIRANPLSVLTPGALRNIFGKTQP